MRLFVAVLLLMPSVALAQTPAPTPPPLNVQLSFCQKAGTALQNQRNTANDQVAQCSANYDLANEELAKAQAEIADLKKKLAAVPPTPAPAPETPAK